MDGSITTEIVRAVADAKATEPTDLEITLSDHIDSEAIERLADHGSASWTLSFELPEHNVTVTSDGLILVDGRRKTVWA